MPYSTFSARRTKCAKSALRQVPSRKIRRRLEANCKLLHCDLKIIFARSKNFCTRSLDKDFIYIISKDNKEYATNVIIQGDESFKEMIHLKDSETNQPITLKNDEIVISEKITKLLDIKVGEEITIKKDNQEYHLKVQAIAENYIDHYAYMNKITYEKYFETYLDNSLLLTNNNLNNQEEKELNTFITDQSQGAIITTSILFNKYVEKEEII